MLVSDSKLLNNHTDMLSDFSLLYFRPWSICVCSENTYRGITETNFMGNVRIWPYFWLELTMKHWQNTTSWWCQHFRSKPQNCQWRTTPSKVPPKVQKIFLFGHLKTAVNHPRIWLAWFYQSPVRQNDADEMSHLMTKPTKWPLRPVKTQNSLGWSVSLLCAQWVAKEPSFLRWAQKPVCWFCHEAAQVGTV